MGQIKGLQINLHLNESNTNEKSNFYVPVLKMNTSLLQPSGSGSGLGNTPPNTSNSSLKRVHEWYDLIGALPVV